MKTCSKCKELKDESEFGFKTKGKRQSYCRPCNNERNRQYYANNKDRQKQVVYKRNLKYKKELRAWLVELKESKPCMDCGVRYPWYVMDFDHIGDNKFKDVSRMAVEGYSKLKIQEEIDKCDLVCSNCHRIRTFTRGEPVEAA